jgi:tetratricopeptide (TPR) repeat protein
MHLDWGLPEVYEEATPARESVEFWGSPGEGLDLNPRFFKYPSFTLYLNFMVQSVAYLWLSLTGDVGSLNEFRQFLGQQFPRVVLLGRVLQALLGALVVIPAWILGRGLGGAGSGWLAGALVAVLPLLVVESQLVSPDMALTLFSMAALVAATRLAARGSRSDYLWCGLWIGLAAASKYPGAILLSAFFTAHAVWGRKQGDDLGRLVTSSTVWQGLFTAAVVFVAASPYVLLDASVALSDIGFEGRHMRLGHLGREEGRAWLLYLTRAVPAGWTPVAAAAGLLGAVILLARKESRGRALPGAVFAATLFLVLGSWKMAAPRYLLPLVPLSAAWGGVAVAAGPRWLLGARPGATPLSIVLGSALLLWPLLSSLSQVTLRGRVDSRLAATEWIEENAPEGSAILLERYGPEPDGDRFLLLHLPFHGVTPHVYDAAYVAPLYATFDYVVFSSGVSARYLARPREYPVQVAFYATLDRAFREVASFPSGIYMGPDIRILERREDVQIKELDALPPAYFTAQKGNRPMAEYLSALGTVLVRQGREDLGFRMLQEGVELDAESPKIWGNLGSMRLRTGRYEDALTAYRRAHTLDPEDPGVLFNLGTLYSRMGEWDQAASSFRRVLALRPEMEETYVSLARALVGGDHYAEARLVLSEFLHRFPRSAHRAAAEEALEELRRMGPGRP